MAISAALILTCRGNARTKLPLCALMPASEITLKGQIEDIIFENEANGYKVLAVSGDEEFIAVGNLPGLGLGEMVELTGEWVDHPAYGQQLKVSHFQPILPDSEDAIYHYLCSGLIKGIGPRTAARLISLYGARTLDVLRHEPEKVAKIKGIGLRKAERIAAQLAEKLEYQDLVLLLSPHGIGTGLVFRIFRQWGSGAADRIRTNPYDLADEIDGIGFHTADRVARAIGLSEDAPARLASALKFQSTQFVYQGHTWNPRNELLMSAAQLVAQPPHRLEPVLDDLIETSQLIQFSASPDMAADRVALPVYFQMEKSAADLLRKLLNTTPTRFAEWQNEVKANRVLEAASQGLGLELADEQKQALQMALRESFCVLTGGPGTGKTTIIRVLTDCFKRQGGKVLLAAPTGRAARRLSELTDCPAQTLHRLLALPFSGQSQTDSASAWFGMSGDVTLNCDLLVVDEVSMLDVVLFRSLLDAIVPGTRVLLVGDADQLPAIGPGQVLLDLLDSGTVPAVRLTQIFRQSAESLIVRNAHHILKGQRLESDQSFESNFILVVKDQADAMGQAAIKLGAEILPGQYGFDPRRDVQVLTPLHKGPAGTAALNQALQGEIDEDCAISAHGISFVVGDKVMQMRNQYELAWTTESAGDTSGNSSRRGSSGSAGSVTNPGSSKGKGVFNGEVGIVTAVDTEEDELSVLFDDGRLVVYDRGALEDLDLAYAMTIHKSQGSEYPVVVLVIPPTAPRLLTRNLLYTAVTRAKQKLLLITSRPLLASMLANQQTSQRNTMLREWLSAPTKRP